MIPRYFLVRPHTFSYLFIALFIYLLEHKSKAFYFLPLLGILWANVHGIEYPVLILVTSSYTVELLYNRIRKKSYGKYGFIKLIFLTLTLYSIIITPHNLKLLHMPFISTAHASRYIKELRLLSVPDYFSYIFDFVKPTYLTSFNLILIISLFSFLVVVVKKKLRISHLLLYGGGLYLLSKGLRFLSEFSLLSLPLIITGIKNTSFIEKSNIKKPSLYFILSIFIISVILYFHSFNLRNLKYPLSTKNLPVGNVTFLKKLNVGGNILNYPNDGGFLQWELYPKYKIFMDMEVPYLFSDSDFFIAANVFRNEPVFRKVIAKYNPEAIIVPLEIKEFQNIVKKDNTYELVFFDDKAALYLNRKTFPEITEEYKLRYINPFTIIGKNVANLPEQEKENIKNEMQKILSVYKDCSFVNQILGMIYNSTKDFDTSIKFAENIINAYPEDPKGYRLKGDALMGKKEYDEAISFFNKALRLSPDEKKNNIYIKLWYCNYKMKKYKAAYSYLKRAVDIFSPATSFVDLYNLAETALLAGKLDDSLFIASTAYLKVPEDETEWKTKFDDFMKQFELPEGIPQLP
jgi:tetratricopeptide (TPR) repeat protein